jgi:hypothetical protein
MRVGKEKSGCQPKPQNNAASGFSVPTVRSGPPPWKSGAPFSAPPPPIWSQRASSWSRMELCEMLVSAAGPTGGGPGGAPVRTGASGHLGDSAGDENLFRMVLLLADRLQPKSAAEIREHEEKGLTGRDLFPKWEKPVPCREW